MNPNDPKNKKTLELLQQLGIDPADIKRESSPELLIPKMAILGFLETIRGFCENGKANISASITGLNSNQLRLLMSAMRGSIDLIERTLEQYEIMRKQARAKDLVDNIIPLVRGSKKKMAANDNDEASGKPLSRLEIEARLRKMVSEVAQEDDDLEESDEDIGIFEDDDEHREYEENLLRDQKELLDTEEELDAFRSKNPKKPIIH